MINLGFYSSGTKATGTAGMEHPLKFGRSGSQGEKNGSSFLNGNFRHESEIVVHKIVSFNFIIFMLVFVNALLVCCKIFLVMLWLYYVCCTCIIAGITATA